jgi:two-component system cell cycle response regulator DivK
VTDVVRRHRPSVLLVDDFEDALNIYGEFLTFRGYEVIIARDGAEAVERARAQWPDVILLDLSMPVLSGLEAVRILRADPAFDDVPIVALTAHAFDSERLAALKAGFDEVISKPCLPQDLTDAVERILSGSHAGALVLLATQMDDHARSYRAVLARRGFRVNLTRTGSEAVQFARAARPQCAVIDVRLPDMPGWEVCRLIKTQPECPGTRVIVLTPDLTPAGAMRSAETGCQAWLTQPTTAEELAQTVREVLESDRDRPAAPELAILGLVPCPACASPDVAAAIRVGLVQYYNCRGCRFRWRVESVGSVS